MSTKCFRLECGRLVDFKQRFDVSLPFRRVITNEWVLQLLLGVRQCPYFPSPALPLCVSCLCIARLVMCCSLRARFVVCVRALSIAVVVRTRDIDHTWTRVFSPPGYGLPLASAAAAARGSMRGGRSGANQNYVGYRPTGKVASVCVRACVHACAWLYGGFMGLCLILSS